MKAIYLLAFFAPIPTTLGIVPQTQLCYDVPFSTPSLCTRDGLEEESYDCDEGGLKCRFESREMQSTCFRSSFRTEKFECLKDVSETMCGMVPIIEDQTCYREEEPDDCFAPLASPAPFCTTKLASAPATCTRLTKKEQKYNCIKTEPHRKCKNAVKLRNTEMCTRTILPSQNNLCRTKPKCAKTTNLCSRRVKTVKKTKCIQKPKNCTLKEQMVNNICKREVHETQTYKCPNKKIQCPEVPIQTKALCTKRKFLREEYECGSNLRVHNLPLKKCMRELPSLETYPCTKTVMVKKCSFDNQRDIIRQDCYRNIVREEEYPCQTLQKVRHCELEDNVTGELCEEPEEEVEEFECDSYDGNCLRDDEDDTEYESCILGGAIEERFACGSTEEKCEVAFVPVESICVKTVPWVEEYPCTRPVRKRVCENSLSLENLVIPPNPLVSPLVSSSKFGGLLGDSLTVQHNATFPSESLIPIESKRDIAIGNSSILPTGVTQCGKKLKASYKCSTVRYEEKCEQVQTKKLKNCTVSVPVSEPFQCTKKVKQRICKPDPKPLKAKCYKDVLKTEEYKCFKLCEKQHCKSYPLGTQPIHRSQLQNPFQNFETNSILQGLTHQANTHKNIHALNQLQHISQNNLQNTQNNLQNTQNNLQNAQNNLQNIPQNNLQDIPQNNFQNNLQNISQNNLQNTHFNVPKNNLKNTPENNPFNIPPPLFNLAIEKKPTTSLFRKI